MNRWQQGFTLIELMISVVILAGLMAILFGGLHLGARVVTKQSGQLDRATQVALVENFLRTQLADAQPLLAGDESGTVDFTGQSESIDFISPAAESVEFGGLQVLAVAFVEAPHAPGKLLLRWRRYRDTGTGDKAAEADHSTVLLDQLRQGGFTYYGLAPQDASAAWQESWQAQPFLPLLVRFSATFDDGETVPDLTIALRLATSAAEQTQRHQRF